MNKPFLTQLPLTYADSISFGNSGALFWFKIVNREHQLLIYLKNIILLNFSKDSVKSDEYWIDIIEITHEYRKLTQHDLRKYSFSSKNVDDAIPLHIITIYGNTIVEIICEEIEIEKGDCVSSRSI
ncbi:MAG: hypothetical protein MUE44_05985 [Oscillatoriaceae cyanobacterium Prado104]|jgi:hypothetical protein|nr:hypothetical protein [Oscillatoriaceae cyanobacterium Prado104]